jgi:hypothetical protein
MVAIIVDVAGLPMRPMRRSVPSLRKQVFLEPALQLIND